MVVLLAFSLHVMFLVLWKVVATQLNRCGIQGQNYVAWLQGIEMPVGFHYTNLRFYF